MRTIRLKKNLELFELKLFADENLLSNRSEPFKRYLPKSRYWPELKVEFSKVRLHIGLRTLWSFISKKHINGAPKKMGGNWVFLGEDGVVYQIQDNTIDIEKLPFHYPGTNENGENILLLLLDSENDDNCQTHLENCDNHIQNEDNRNDLPSSKKGKLDAGGGTSDATFWTDDDTRLLITLYGTYHVKIKTRQIPTARRMWELIQNEMALQGCTFSAAQVENKWKVLLRGYKKTKQVHGSSGRGRISCTFEEELDEILLKKPNVSPVVMRGPGKTIRQNQLKSVFHQNSTNVAKKSSQDVVEEQAECVDSDMEHDSVPNLESSRLDSTTVENLQNLDQNTEKKKTKRRLTVAQELRKLREEIQLRHEEKLELKRKQHEEKMKYNQGKLECLTKILDKLPE